MRTVACHSLSLLHAVVDYYKEIGRMDSVCACWEDWCLWVLFQLQLDSCHLSWKRVLTCVLSQSVIHTGSDLLHAWLYRPSHFACCACATAVCDHSFGVPRCASQSAHVYHCCCDCECGSRPPERSTPQGCTKWCNHRGGADLHTLIMHVPVALLAMLAVPMLFFMSPVVSSSLCSSDCCCTSCTMGCGQDFATGCDSLLLVPLVLLFERTAATSRHGCWR